MRAFFDTNVLVYLFDNDAAEKQERARELLARQAGSGQVLLSTQVLQEFFVAVTRKLSRPLPVDDAAQAIRRLAAFQVVQADTGMILEAIAVSKRFGISFWDALIVQAARQGGAEILYSEDLQHNQDVVGVRIVNPFLPNTQ
jgi:predicted nucleic acid-binding protein